MPACGRAFRIRFAGRQGYLVVDDCQSVRLSDSFLLFFLLFRRKVFQLCDATVEAALQFELEHHAEFRSALVRDSVGLFVVKPINFGIVRNYSNASGSRGFPAVVPWLGDCLERVKS